MRQPPPLRRHRYDLGYLELITHDQVLAERCGRTVRLVG